MYMYMYVAGDCHYVILSISLPMLVGVATTVVPWQQSLPPPRES